MTAYRTKPKIGDTQAAEAMPKAGDDQIGCLWIPPVIVISYIVLFAIMRVLSNAGSKLDQTICYGALIIVAIVFILGMRDMYRDHKVRAAETKKWLKACAVAQVEIMDRHEGGSYNDGYDRFRYFPCRLELAMNADQRAVSPNQTTVSVDVSQSIYDKLAARDTVRIYYLPEAPLAFLLEEET